MKGDPIICVRALSLIQTDGILLEVRKIQKLCYITQILADIHRQRQAKGDPIVCVRKSVNDLSSLSGRRVIPQCHR